MAHTVDAAFNEFISNSVRLNPRIVDIARSSQNNIITNINCFSGDNDFFNLLPEAHLKFGSFARSTKTNPLDDIDLMICIMGDGRNYEQDGDVYYITGLENDRSLLADDQKYISSTKVINRFIKKLRSVHDYSKAEMHKNMEAATVQLRSYSWNFDIVPCWYMDIDKYLIPDGYGNWKKTDPRIDNDRIIALNKKHKGKLLDIIRLLKYWNGHINHFTIDSYLLECIILNIYETKPEQDYYYFDLEFRDLLSEISRRIRESVYDPKGIQGNINRYTYGEKTERSLALSFAHKIAYEARELEKNGDQKAAIEKWKEILGNEFPNYE